MAFESGSEVKTYVRAGKALVTIVSEKTGKRYTYKVRQAKDRETGKREDKWFVSLLTGPDNEASYTYMGMLFGDTFRLTAKSRYTVESVPVKAFAWFWRHVVKGEMPPDVEVMHSGCCGRCGRTLTVPESVRTGLGPECAAKMGL